MVPMGGPPLRGTAAADVPKEATPEDEEVVEVEADEADDLLCDLCFLPVDVDDGTSLLCAFLAKFLSAAAKLDVVLDGGTAAVDLPLEVGVAGAGSAAARSPPGGTSFEPGRALGVERPAKALYVLSAALRTSARKRRAAVCTKVALWKEVLAQGT